MSVSERVKMRFEKRLMKSCVCLGSRVSASFHVRATLDNLTVFNTHLVLHFLTVHHVYEFCSCCAIASACKSKSLALIKIVLVE